MSQPMFQQAAMAPPIFQQQQPQSFNAAASSVFDTRSSATGRSGSGTMKRSDASGSGGAFDFMKNKDAFNFVAAEVGKNRK